MASAIGTRPGSAVGNRPGRMVKNGRTRRTDPGGSRLPRKPNKNVYFGKDGQKWDIPSPLTDPPLPPAPLFSPGKLFLLGVSAGLAQLFGLLNSRGPTTPGDLNGYFIPGTAGRTIRFDFRVDQSHTTVFFCSGGSVASPASNSSYTHVGQSGGQGNGVRFKNVKTEGPQICAGADVRKDLEVVRVSPGGVESPLFGQTAYSQQSGFNMFRRDKERWQGTPVNLRNEDGPIPLPSPVPDPVYLPPPLPFEQPPPVPEVLPEALPVPVPVPFLPFSPPATAPPAEPLPFSPGSPSPGGVPSPVGVPLPRPLPNSPPAPIASPVPAPAPVPNPVPQPGPDGVPVPVPVPQPPVTPPDVEQTPDGPVGGGGSPPPPTLPGIAAEVGKIEQKVLKLLDRPAPQQLDLSLLDLIRLIYELLTSVYPGGSFQLQDPCSVDAEGNPVEPDVSTWGGGVGKLGEIEAKIEAVAELLQFHKNQRQPVCKGRPIAGTPVTVLFEEVE